MTAQVTPFGVAFVLLKKLPKTSFGVKVALVDGIIEKSSMVVDFQEELNICRSTDQFGNPKFLPLYDFAHTKTDLTDDTVTIIDWNTEISLGEACNLIDSFGGSELTTKARIRHFLEHDCIRLTDEY